MRPPHAAGLVSVLLASSCVPAIPVGGPAAEGPLVSSLSVTTGEADVGLVLQVTNASEGAVELVFPTGQTHYFAVSAAGSELWRWSADRAFTQAVQLRVLAPGETLEFAERWTPPPGTGGDLEVEARLASSSHPLRRSAVIRLP
jgi:hypothetical protein